MPSTIASARGRCFQGTGFVNKGGARERVQTAKEGGGWQKAEKAEGAEGTSERGNDDGEELRSTEQRESQRWWWLKTKRDSLLLLVGSVACRSSIPEVTCPPASLSRRTHCAIPLNSGWLLF